MEKKEQSFTSEINFKVQDLTPAELKAIEEHKYYMGLELGCEVSIEQALSDFIKKYREDWLRDKHEKDMQSQKMEIIKHKYFRSQEEGRDIGEDRAVDEWRKKYAKIWRSCCESLEHNDFYSLRVTIPNKKGLHLNPVSTLVSVVKGFDCDVFIHKPGLEHYNFILQGRPFVHIKSVFTLMGVAAIQGDTIEFIAYGREAEIVLERIRQFIEELAQSDL